MIGSSTVRLRIIYILWLLVLCSVTVWLVIIISVCIWILIIIAVSRTCILWRILSRLVISVRIMRSVFIIAVYIWIMVFCAVWLVVAFIGIPFIWSLCILLRNVCVAFRCIFSITWINIIEFIWIFIIKHFLVLLKCCVFRISYDVYIIILPSENYMNSFWNKYEINWNNNETKFTFYS